MNMMYVSVILNGVIRVVRVITRVVTTVAMKVHMDQKGVGLGVRVIRTIRVIHVVRGCADMTRA